MGRSCRAGHRGATVAAMPTPADTRPLPTAQDVDAAAQVLRGIALRTPLIASPALDALTGARVFLKAETLQRTGSFKFRGAYNKLAAIPPDRRAGGVVAFSSGNHAQGVAAAARLLGMPAVIVMPSDAPQGKRARTAALGAEVVLFDRAHDDREAIARDIAVKRNAVLVPPYDDPLVIAGQGTVGREIIEDLATLGLVPDVIAVTASGGGLTGTICDALMARMPGELTFAINRALVGEGVVATDQEVAAAMAFAFHELKLVVEPGGAVALAALMANKIDVRGKIAVAVLSGGNVDAELFHRLVA
jgi:threonine dehydratase